MSGLELRSRTTEQTVNLAPRRSLDQLQMWSMSALCWFVGFNLWIKTKSGLYSTIVTLESAFDTGGRTGFDRRIVLVWIGQAILVLVLILELVCAQEMGAASSFKEPWTKVLSTQRVNENANAFVLHYCIKQSYYIEFKAILGSVLWLHDISQWNCLVCCLMVVSVNTSTL